MVIISHPNEIRYITAQAKVSHDQAGIPVRLTGINQDVTTMELEKLKVLHLNQQIKDNEKKYRALFEFSGDAIMLLDENKFLECNDATLSMFLCQSRSDFLGHHPSELSPTYQDDGRTSKIAADLYIANAIKEGTVRFPWTHRRLNGETFPAQVLLTPIAVNKKTLLQATVRDITDQVELQERLLRLSTHDQLTGLFNRSQLQSSMSEEKARADRSRKTFSILMLDLDHFKQINDNFGHQVGDKVLQHFAKILRSSIRQNDTAIRFGGEEFLVILPLTTTKTAIELANRICSTIAKSTVKNNDDQNIHYTVSIGVATYPDDGRKPSDLLSYVDKALYKAKKTGRNKVSYT